MSHYARLNEAMEVISVFSIDDGEETADEIEAVERYYFDQGMTVLKTSYRTSGGIHYDLESGEPSEDQAKAFRGNYAGIGFTYDETLDAFFEPQPYPSWILDKTTYSWVPPIPHPDDGETYEWDEGQGDWVQLQEPDEA